MVYASEQYLVAKKKPSQPTNEPDQHASGFMIRLPEEYRELLKQIKSKTGRAMTVATQIALEQAARALDIDFKPNWPETT